MALESSNDPIQVAPKACIRSPFSFWTGECDDRELAMLRLGLGRYWIELYQDCFWERMQSYYTP